MNDEPRELNGPAVIQAVMSLGPIQIGDLVVTLRAAGYDTGTARLTALLGALRKSGRLINVEGFWTYNVVSILRLDEQQTATLHLLYEAVDTLAASVNELVRMLTNPDSSTERRLLAVECQLGMPWHEGGGMLTGTLPDGTIGPIKP